MHAVPTEFGPCFAPHPWPFRNILRGALAGLWRQRERKRKKGAAQAGKPVSSETALKRLLRGNERYFEGVMQRHDFKREREALVGGQNPYAAILSCADLPDRTRVRL